MNQLEYGHVTWRMWSNGALGVLVGALAHIGLFAMSLPAIAAWSSQPVLNVVLDGTGSGRMFQGIGATSGGGATSRLLIDYPKRQRDEILDFLFKPNFGAALQTLKVEIGSDANSTEGGEPTHARTPTERNFERGYEWWIATEARKRNPGIKLIALAWNFPAWVGVANSQATADYLVSFLEGARDHHGLDFDYVGIWNETRMDVAFIKTLHATLAAHGLKTRIVADDAVNSWDIVQAMDSDPQLRAAVDVIATHYPRWLSTPLARSKSAEWQLPLWSSEDGPWDDGWAVAGQQSPPLATLLNRNYIQGRMTSTNIWNLITSYSDAYELPNAGLLRAKTPWSGHYEITSPLWVVAHTNQFARPGWRYIDSASALVDGVGSYVTLHDGKSYSVVVETLDASKPQAFKFSVRSGLSQGPVYIWRSNRSHWFERVGRIEPRAGAYEISLEPNSVYTLTTTTGQARGQTMPPADRPLPVPYHDDFETPGGSLAPRFLFEANGAFEIGACEAGRAGRCLQQVAEQSPIAWTYFGDWPKAGTMATLGEERWRDYKVAADVLVSGKGYAALFARVSHVTSDGAIDAYQLRMYADGRWELRASAIGEPLRAGQGMPSQGIWRRVELVVHGERITASIAGTEVATVTDATQATGLAGLGAGWNKASYDNFEVNLAAPHVPIISAGPVAALARVPPRTPELLVPQATDHAVRLTWKPVVGASSYRVQIGTKENAFDRTDKAGHALTYTYRTLTNGTKYYFAVSAVNAAGASKPATQYAVPMGSEGVP